MHCLCISALGETFFVEGGGLFIISQEEEVNCDVRVSQTLVFIEFLEGAPFLSVLLQGS